MAYTDGFEHDIYLSYARVDDMPSPGEKKGWVDSFSRHLQIELTKRLGTDVSIWRFEAFPVGLGLDQQMRSTIDASAVFLALLSPKYLKSDNCRQELEYFLREGSTGPVAGDRPRVVNVLINNVSPDEWPTGLEQTTGFAFYDTKSDDDLGEPSEPDSDLFERQLRDLVDALYDLLRTTKEAGAGARPPYPPVTSRTYPQRQAELALEHAASTLIWIPHDLQIAEIDDENHRAFLEQLQRDERVADFIQSGPDEITRIILEKIEQAQGASESGNDASSHRHLSARVVGRVQGVNFRTFIRKEAQALGLTGWVRNERDGSVSMEAEGSHAALETLLAAARRGPAMARVDHVEVDWSEATGKFDEFALRF